jgi:CheY-like chemotaxis protein
MNARVALADDEPDARRVLARLLERLGCVVTLMAEDGTQLVAASLVNNVDLVILDLDMPEQDGLETAEELARHGLPVILVSGHPDLHHLVLDQEPLVTALAKPIFSNELERAIRLALNLEEKE